MPYLGNQPTASDSLSIFKYVATASQATFSGADSNGQTLSYDVGDGSCQVFLNGVRLDSTTDVTATNGTSVVLAACTAGDIVHIQATKAFIPADVVPKAAGGTFGGAVVAPGLTLSSTPLPVASGGTGTATHSANGVLLGAGTGAVTTAAPSTSGNVLTSNGTVWQSTTPAAGASKPNLIRNSDFTIWQRGTSFASPTSHDYCADGWKYQWESGYAGRVTITKDTTGIFSAWGSPNCMKIDCTTIDTSLASSDMAAVIHTFEAQDLQQLEYGTAGARTMSLSFLFRSPKSGAHCVALYTQDSNRVRTFDFTVASADTAERITIEGITGDTGGSGIANDTGQGLQLIFPFAAGSGRQSDAANNWVGGYSVSTANQQNLLDNTSNNIYIGQVKLEVNDTVTDYEFEDYATALHKAQRYYWKGGVGAAGGALATANGMFGGQFPTEMRAAPTITINTGHSGVATSFYVVDSGGSGLQTTGASIYDSYIDDVGCCLLIDGWSGGNALTQHRPHVIYNYTVAPFSFTAEL